MTRTKMFSLSALSALSFAFFACSAGAPSGPEAQEDGPPSVGDGDGESVIDLSAAAGVNCGDGNLDPGEEACDDGNRDDGDGCSSNCLSVERGFICPTAGEPCDPFARCGDGVIAFPEQCDDGNVATGDGCSELCKFEIGYTCDDGGCRATTCGDGKVEGAETCDTADPATSANCSEECVGEPACAAGGGACTSTCGDGIVVNEDCDDGNLLDGDGCSSSCTIEPGYECKVEDEQCDPNAEDCKLVIPAVFRDFEESHPDFQSCDVDGVTTGMVKGTLDAEGKPVPAQGSSTHCATKLEDWYRDTSDSVTVNGEITLWGSGDGRYVNRYGENGEQWNWVNDKVPAMQVTDDYTTCDPDVCEKCPDGWGTENAGCSIERVIRDGDPAFFPVDDIGTDKAEAMIGGDYISNTDDPDNPFDDEFRNEKDILGGPATLHNFYFTTEVTYWFAFGADTDATLEFTGDDDVWVFVNGKLAVDLGGTHPPGNGSVTLNAGTAASYGLEAGNVYEIKIFHAERKQSGSSFRLTLDGFSTSRSVCTAVCGDGIIGFGEECDDGENDGGYNECQVGCKLGGYCGDGIVQEGEACDDADPTAPGGCSGCQLLR